MTCYLAKCLQIFHFHSWFHDIFALPFCFLKKREKRNMAVMAETAATASALSCKLMKFAIKKGSSLDFGIL